MADRIAPTEAFLPLGRTPRAARIKWPKVHINDAVANMDLMILSQLGLASDLLAEDQRRRIYEPAREDGSARVSSLSEPFAVNEPTIRSDLQKLEREGLVIRDHGGTYLRGIETLVRSGRFERSKNAGKKLIVGRKAAEFVHDNDTLILDSGSTVTELAENLLDRRNLHIVTNALNSALLVGSESGLSYPGLSGLPEKHAMLLAARTAYLLTDFTKIGETSFAVVGDLSEVNVLITDTDIDAESVRMLESLGTDAVIA